jgi:hypothetical protein
MQGWQGIGRSIAHSIARNLVRNWGNAFDIQLTGSGMEVHRARRSCEEPGEESGREHDERMDEARKLRRLQVMMSMVMSVISQDPDLTLEEAAEMSANARRAALSMFPDKELAYDILYRPRLQRLMNERFRLQ